MISIKTLIYSPIIEADEQSFFEQMEFASSFGADLLVLGEGVKNPYTELLSGMDVLNGDEYNYVLESLYGFCFELGCAAVFNGIDDFGMHFCIFANPFAQEGETFNKLYIKHATQNGSVFELEDYIDCIDEIFDPVVFKGAKLAMCMGDDVYLPKLFERYRLNGATIAINCFKGDNDFKNYNNALCDICQANNMVIVSAGTNGRVQVNTPLGCKEVQKLTDNLYISEFCKADFAKKCGLLQNDLSSCYVPSSKAELYKLI